MRWKQFNSEAIINKVWKLNNITSCITFWHYNLTPCWVVFLPQICPSQSGWLPVMSPLPAGPAQHQAMMSHFPKPSITRPITQRCSLSPQREERLCPRVTDEMSSQPPPAYSTPLQPLPYRPHPRQAEEKAGPCTLPCHYQQIHSPLYNN